MNDWAGLRTAAVVVGWLTVAGGLILAVGWVALGGGRAIGPEDELAAQRGTPVSERNRSYTAFTSVQVGMHGLLGLGSVILLSHAATRSGDRPAGYAAVLVLIAVTAIPGLLMFRKWRSRRRPAIDGTSNGGSGPKVEDRLPKIVVLLHGAAAGALVILLVLLVVVERRT